MGSGVQGSTFRASLAGDQGSEAATASTSQSLDNRIESALAMKLPQHDSWRGMCVLHMLALAKEMETRDFGLQHITSETMMHDLMERVAAMDEKWRLFTNT